MAAASLESPLPRTLPPGSSIALFCSGTACEPVDLEFVVGGATSRPAAFRMPRFDIPCRRSGFWGVVPLQAPGDGTVEIGVDVELPGGRRENVALGRIEVAEREPAPLPLAAPASPGLIAICMGTYEPDPEMFRRQVESIRAQTDTDWVCVVSDDHSSDERHAEMRSAIGSDARFLVSRAESRAGFYRNFERALGLAPAEAGLVAFCDQDDVWHPDKLAVLRRSMGEAMLVYSDLRLVDDLGRVLRETLWRGRRNNSTNLVSMLIANTVTGAAALFRREVVERALPFPDSPGIEFHDHWIALTALACGDLAYVERPLYDYVQHRGAVVGTVAAPLQQAPPRRGWLRLPRLRDWRADYFLGYVPGEVRAQTLLLRCHDRLTPEKRRALERYLAAGRSAGGLAWLVLRPLRMLAGRTETLGLEWQLAIGVLWRHLATLVARVPGWPDRFTLDTRFPDPADFEQKRLRRWRERV